MKKKPCVLLIDDDKSVRTALSRALRSSGIDVDLAATLEEGMAKLEKHNLVLADLNLPDGKSTSILRRVRELGGLIRVAIISGSLDALAIVEGSGERPDAIFEKCCNLQELLDWIAEPSLP